MKKHNIDKILKDWAARREERRKDTSELVQRITSRVRKEPSPVPSRELSGGEPRPNPYAVGLATAAVTAIAVAGFFLAWPFAENGLRADPAGTITIHQKERHEKQKLLTEMDNVFQSRLQWVSESNDRMQINVADSRSKQAGNGVPVLLKVLLLRQTDNGEDPQVTWKGNVIARSEQVITVNPTSDKPENRMTFWLYPLNSSGVLVDFDLRFKTPFHLRSSSTNHVVTKRPSRVLSAGGGNGQYKMFLAAAQLRETDRCSQNSQKERTGL